MNIKQYRYAAAYDFLVSVMRGSTVVVSCKLQLQSAALLAGRRRVPPPALSPPRFIVTAAAAAGLRAVGGKDQGRREAAPHPRSHSRRRSTAAGQKRLPLLRFRPSPARPLLFCPPLSLLHTPFISTPVPTRPHRGKTFLKTKNPPLPRPTTSPRPLRQCIRPLPS